MKKVITTLVIVLVTMAVTYTATVHSLEIETVGDRYIVTDLFGQENVYEEGTR